MAKSKKILLTTGFTVALLSALGSFFAWGKKKAPPPSPAHPVDPARLEAHVRMLAETLSPRDYEHTDNLDRVAEYISREFKAAGAEVSEQSYEAFGRTYRNVLGFFGPKSEERIVIGAHYDTAGPLPGADDNASGVAGLLELAHLLAKAPLPLRVELVAYTLEEPPFFRTDLMGSAVHARSLKEAGVKVRAMLSLEMIGYFSDEPRTQRFPTALMRPFYPSKGNFITVVGLLSQGKLVRKVKRAMRSVAALPVEAFRGPRFVEGVDFSDHLNYWNEGYPAVMITDTAFFRNERYHTREDTPDTLDYHRMAGVVLGVYQAVLSLSAH